MKRHEQCCVNACWGSAECWKWSQYVATWRQTFLIWCLLAVHQLQCTKDRELELYKVYCVRSRSSLRTSLWKTCHRLCFHVVCQSSWLAASPSTPCTQYCCFSDPAIKAWVPCDMEKYIYKICQTNDHFLRNFIQFLQKKRLWVVILSFFFLDL